MLLQQEPSDTDRIDPLVIDVITAMCNQEPIEFCKSRDIRGMGPEDKLCGLLMSNLDAPLDIGTLCDCIGTDKYGISQKFSKIYGCTPYAFHKRCRLIKAAAEMSLSDRPMQEIAESIGYLTENKFADAFKREFGCRPRQFIKGSPSAYPSPVLQVD